MTLEDDLKILKKVSLFQRLDEEHLRHLAFGAEAVQLRNGAALYNAGEPAGCAYIIISGTMMLEHNETLSGPYGTAVLLGETSLIVATEWNHSAYAASDASLMRINRSLFRRILEAYPSLAQELHDYMAERLQKLVKDIEPVAKRFT